MYNDDLFIKDLLLERDKSKTYSIGTFLAYPNTYKLYDVKWYKIITDSNKIWVPIIKE